MPEGLEETVMREDRRASPRQRLRRDEVPGEFYLLLLGGERLILEDAYDVSVSGMGIGLSQCIPVGAVVRVGYRDGDFAIELDAKVAWCEDKKGDGPHRMGLRFSPDPRQANDNALFFMTLREYLDDFGDLP